MCVTVPTEVPPYFCTMSMGAFTIPGGSGRSRAMPTRFAVALSTAPNVEKAAEIARALVLEGLCACVNIVPGVRSIYFWDGELCDGAEVMCVIKTRADRVEALRERLIALH